MEFLDVKLFIVFGRYILKRQRKINWTYENLLIFPFKSEMHATQKVAMLHDEIGFQFRKSLIKINKIMIINVFESISLKKKILEYVNILDPLIVINSQSGFLLQVVYGN